MKAFLNQRIVLSVIFSFSLCSIAAAQQIPQLSSAHQRGGKALKTIQSNTNADYLRVLAQETKEREDSLKALANKLAHEKGWMTAKTFEDGSMVELMGVSQTGGPLYYATHNVDAAATTSTDRVHPGGDLGLNLSGMGMTIGEWDGGDVLTTHN
ncbi:MAG TPA: hypothetical protein VJ894_02960, partial [Cryomorphaceae bacterium]|nr:hypothetical protein [Cryomorphaceae bacterium]